MESLRAYRSAVDFDDFVDFLYSNKILDEKEYYRVWIKVNADRELRLHRIFEILQNKSECFDKITKYLRECYPNNDGLIEDERNFQDSSIRGGFPKLPPNYVKRNSLAEEVKSKLLGLTWKKKLIIHGMMGYGKSCLINEVLSSQSIRNVFDNCLFWINLGDCHSKLNVLQPLWRLYTSASAYVGRSVTHTLEIDALKNLLVDLFLKEERLRNALIILDDCCDEEVLDYFDIGRITVITTQRKNILKREETEFTEVVTGFSLNESLELFRKALKTDGELPNYAEKIHSICQGHPMLIAHIGSYLQQNSNEISTLDDEIWLYIEKMLLQGNYRLNEYDDSNCITGMIKKCVEKMLLNDLKNFYLDLSIFAQDVNIPPKVLEILWNKSSIEVRNIMNKFREQSLIVSFYHYNLNTYIYGIHEIHLNYIKDVTRDRSVELHRKLIEGYDKLTMGNYELLPDDNYSFQFIGYHLFHAEMFDKFEIFFNLGFLEKKLRAVGKEDVLRDMKKYRDYITRRDHNLEKKLHQYEDFIQRYGSNLYNYPKTDIFQYAIWQNKQTFLYKNATETISNRRQQALYFKQQKPLKNDDYSETIDIDEEITYACFVDTSQHILIGTNNGKIKLFYELAAKEISSFVGHKKSIKRLILSPTKRYFLSTSLDESIKLFKFSAESGRNSKDFTCDFLPASPKTKQSYWCDMHTPDKGQITPKNVFKSTKGDDYLISAQFHPTFPDTPYIVTGSARGNIIVWDTLTETVKFETGPRGIETPCILYLENEPDSIVFAADDLVYNHQIIKDKIVFYTSNYNHESCSGLFYVDECLIVVGMKSISLWVNTKKIKVIEMANDGAIISSALTEDKQYLIVGNGDCEIFVWEIEEWNVVKKFKSKGLPKSLDTFYDEEKSINILLIASNNKTLQQFEIQPYKNNSLHIENLPTFTPFWKRKSPLTCAVTLDNRIQIFNGYTQICDTDTIESKVECACFSACGNYLIYGLNDGRVCRYNLKYKKNYLIDGLKKESVEFLLNFDPNSAFRSHKVSSCGSNDSLDFNEQSDVIVATTAREVFLYKNGEVHKNTVKKPRVFAKKNRLIIVDSLSQVFVWDTDSFQFKKFYGVMETVDVTNCDFCLGKMLLAVSYVQNDHRFLDILQMEDLVTCDVKVIKRRELREEITSMRFNFDGRFLAVGYKSGDIEVKCLEEKGDKSLVLSLHKDQVDFLYFSQDFEPILISLGEVVGFWSLRNVHGKKSRKPQSIDLLTDLTINFDSMNINFWSTRKPLENEKYLLSCLKLNGKAKHFSASNDFNSFLITDDKGKVYIMEIVQ